jgi:hypothetical protein
MVANPTVNDIKYQYACSHLSTSGMSASPGFLTDGLGTVLSDVHGMLLVRGIGKVGFHQDLPQGKELGGTS